MFFVDAKHHVYLTLRFHFAAVFCFKGNVALRESWSINQYCNREIKRLTLSRSESGDVHNFLFIECWGMIMRVVMSTLHVCVCVCVCVCKCFKSCWPRRGHDFTGERLICGLFVWEENKRKGNASGAYLNVPFSHFSPFKKQLISVSFSQWLGQTERQTGRQTDKQAHRQKVRHTAVTYKQHPRIEFCIRTKKSILRIGLLSLFCKIDSNCS